MTKRPLFLVSCVIVVMVAIIGLAAVLHKSKAPAVQSTNQTQPTVNSANSPEVVVDDLYTEMLKQKSQLYDLTVVTKLVKNSPYLTDDFKSRLDQQLQNPQGSYPIVCARQLPDTVTHDQASINSGSAIVPVTGHFKNQPDVHADANLKLVGKEWKVDNVSCK